MRAGAVQLNSTADKARNLEVAERLVRAAAADGAELVALPEKWNLLGGPRGAARRAPSRSTGRPSPRRARWARELGIHLLAGSIAERVDGGRAVQHLGPDRPRGRGRSPSTARSTCSTSTSAASPTASPRHEEPGAEIVTATGRRPRPTIGLTVCYDLRFPELYRILAVRGATADHGARRRSRCSTGRDHWEVLRARPRDREPGLRRRADQVGEAPPHYELLRALDDRRPVGRRAGAWLPTGVLRRRRPRPRRRRIGSARRFPRSPTAAPRPTVAEPEEAERLMAAR